MKRNYLYKHAKYNVILKNFQDEFLRNLLFNLYKNGSVSLSNSGDFFDEGVSTEDENRAILGDIYNLLVNTENRTVELLKKDEIENITVAINTPKQKVEEKSDEEKVTIEKPTKTVKTKPAKVKPTKTKPVEENVTEEKATKKRGRPKGSKNKIN